MSNRIVGTLLLSAMDVHEIGHVQSPRHDPGSMREEPQPARGGAGQGDHRRLPLIDIRPALRRKVGFAAFSSMLDSRHHSP